VCVWGGGAAAPAAAGAGAQGSGVGQGQRCGRRPAEAGRRHTTCMRQRRCHRRPPARRPPPAGRPRDLLGGGGLGPALQLQPPRARLGVPARDPRLPAGGHQPGRGRLDRQRAHDPRRPWVACALLPCARVWPWRRRRRCVPRRPPRVAVGTLRHVCPAACQRCRHTAQGAASSARRGCCHGWLPAACRDPPHRLARPYAGQRRQGRGPGCCRSCAPGTGCSRRRPSSWATSWTWTG
jgi:hypothetical protein